jgi:DNA-binding Lrp family transcriptional regulator
VRLLRVLATDTQKPLAPPEAAELTGLTESGARKALHRLARTGIVERVGQGRTSRYALSTKGGLAERIARLFESEIRNSDALLQAIRAAIRRLDRPPKTAWVHRFPEWDKEPVQVGVSHDVEPFGPILRQMKEEMKEVQAEFEVPVEVLFFSQAELADVDWTCVVPLVGTPFADGPKLTDGEDSLARPEDLASPGELSSVPLPRVNPRSPEFSGALASLLNEDFSLLRRARSHLDEQLADRRDGNGHDFWEWRKILDTYPLPRLLSFLSSSSPRATRLRQCSPFPPVLTEEERDRIKEILETTH